MSRITGPYPGGPGREDEAEKSQRRRPFDLTPAEEMEGRGVDWARRRRAKRRRRRLLVGFVVALVVAGSAGFLLGLQSHRTSEELARQEEARTRGEEGFDLTRERNIILEQLWLMEELEQAPRR